MKNRVAKRMLAISPSLTLAISAKAKAMKAAGEPVVSFGVGEPDFNTPENIIAAAKKALDDAKAALAELNKPTDPNSPQTGDNSNLWLWFALLFVSGAGVFGITLNERKRRTANKR